GKTAFIEPEAVIDINNDLFDLNTEEKREIYRLLKELSAHLRPEIPRLRTYQHLLARFDLIQAKARLGERMEAKRPKLKDEPDFGLQRAFHPLLLLKNKQEGRETVPFDLKLDPPNRMLVLSGPNAGGKSITLKALGLIQLMAQSGLLVPVDEASHLGIFSRFFADIGDQQSLEDDLSTYSSHLENMKAFLEEADDQTLVLIDEFGSGTDPKIGGSIAESILLRLNHKKVYGLVTTHYSNLKIFAFKTKGIVNGSMAFDTESLSPTYRLKIGRPGSSYAFEIAHKSGLPKDVLDYARHRTGKNEKAVDQLLVDLQREKKEVEDKLSELRDKEKQLKRLMKNYEHLQRDLDVRKKKFKLESKEIELQQKSKDNREFERIVREIKEQKNLEKAKELSATIKKKKSELAEEVKDLKEEIYYKPAKKKEERPIREGDFVRLRTGGSTGSVVSIEKGKAVVLMGQMKMTVKLRDLQPANAPLDVQKTKSVQTDTVSRTADFQNKIDIRGMRMEEAVRIIEEFVDQALISNAAHLKIIHGKGSGVLRRAVRQKLREYKVDMDVKHPEPEQGGEGVTLVEIK
ncbi:MAG: Smr/MutS family protein, partial [Saprospiraceae bacterium]|nr:Smr/MutS family protein [Saprospiraceae bacterium]